MQQIYRLLLLALFFNHTSFCMHQFAIRTVDDQNISCPHDTFVLLHNINSRDNTLDLQKLEIQNPYIQLTFDLLTKLITPPNPPLEEQAKNISTAELNILVHTIDYLQPKGLPFVHLCENVKKRNVFNALPSKTQSIVNQTIRPLVVDNHTIDNNVLLIRNTQKFNSLLSFCSRLSALECNNLTAIHISNVPLEHIDPADIAGLWHLPLQELKINYTKIRTLKTGTFKPKNYTFKLLDLSNNPQLTTIEKGAIEPFNNGEIRLINCPHLTEDSKKILQNNLNAKLNIKILFHNARALFLTKISLDSIAPFIYNNFGEIRKKLEVFCMFVLAYKTRSNPTLNTLVTNTPLYIATPIVLAGGYTIPTIMSVLCISCSYIEALLISWGYSYFRQHMPHLFSRFKRPNLDL